MSTEKQERALEKMVENGGNVSKAMRDVGYSENTAQTPQKLTESVGFFELCEERGLTDGLLINALVEDIKKKKGKRKAELELGFKIKGRLITKESQLPDSKQITGIKVVFDRSFDRSSDGSLSEEEKEHLRSLIGKNN